MRIALLATILSLGLSASAQTEQRTRLYLIPGTGADERLFHALDLSEFDTANVRLPVAEWGETMAEYAQRVAATQVDTTRPYAFVGVSLGGMVATELADALSPEFTLVISSAKQRSELPRGYRLARYLPVYRVVGGRTMRWFTKRAQPFFEPMDDEQRDLFMSMIYAKDPRFLQRAVGLMVNWEREHVPEGITHLHGRLDRTLPLRFVEPDLAVRDQGHMLTYSSPELVENVLASLR